VTKLTLTCTTKKRYQNKSQRNNTCVDLLLLCANFFAFFDKTCQIILHASHSKKEEEKSAADNQIIFDTSELLKKTSNTLKVAFQKYPNLKVYLSVEIDC
jgi:hypothetical protein